MAQLLEREQTLEPLSPLGDERFERLYRQSAGHVFGTTARIVGDRELAADITQEVFVRALLHLRAHPTGELREAWLHRVAVNACYDSLRRERRSRTVDLDDAAEVSSSGDQYSEARLAADIQAALASLNVRYRAALVLREVRGLEVSEVATALGVSVSTARVLLHRARRSFRRALRATGAEVPAGALALGWALRLPDVPAASLPAVFTEAPDSAWYARAADLAAQSDAVEVPGLGIGALVARLADLDALHSAREGVAVAVLGLAALLGISNVSGFAPNPAGSAERGAMAAIVVVDEHRVDDGRYEHQVAALGEHGRQQQRGEERAHVAGEGRTLVARQGVYQGGVKREAAAGETTAGSGKVAASHQDSSYGSAGHEAPAHGTASSGSTGTTTLGSGHLGSGRSHSAGGGHGGAPAGGTGHH